jgi:tRNA(Arg) A34 adenosine deaminase TadA
MCAKLIFHAGVTRVYCVRNGYAGGMAGPTFLTRNHVEVVFVDGPADPRSVS